MSSRRRQNRLPFSPMLLVWFALLLSLSACVGYTPPPPTPTDTRVPTPTGLPRVNITPKPTASPTPAPLPVTLEPVNTLDLDDIELVLWRSRPVDEASGGDLLLQMIDEFSRKNEWGITVKVKDYEDYARLFDDLQVSLYGDLPDLFLSYPYQAVHADSSGEFLVDLNAYLNDPSWGMSSAEQADFYPSFWKQDELDGKRLGVPFYRTTQMIYYNLTWGKELGFDEPPATPDEFREQACAAAAASTGAGVKGTGGWAASVEPPVLLAWIYAFGGEVTAGEQQGYAFKQEAVQGSFMFQRALYEDGCSWKPHSRFPLQEFADRKALMIAAGLSSLPDQQSALQQAGSRDRWTVLPFPSADNGPAVVAYGPSFSVVRSIPERQLASWLLIKWLLTPENQARWTEHYHTYPVRASTQNYLVRYLNGNKQWGAALELLPYSRLEPNYPSWRVVRWALSDAASFLYSPVFATERLPALVEELDRTALELYIQYR